MTSSAIVSDASPLRPGIPSRVGKCLCFLLLAQFLAFQLATVFAQNGDKAGEQQVLRVPVEKVPPAPALSPNDEKATFRLPAGFHIELVAAEPLVEMPVALNFDPDGRLWVVEMRGFMPNADGIGETNRVGRIAVLEDTDGDGRMDKRTTFLDGLYQPRAIALIRGGVLVAEPPHLWFCRDTNADNVCDERIEVASDYAVENDPKRGVASNPEHASNGLLWAMDNWIYSANHPIRFRNTMGTWDRETTTDRGQWGISQDDFGRLFFNSNEDQLRGDVVPSHYAKKFGSNLKQPGLNVQIAMDQTVWPARVNPGVNRGYREKQLRADGSLATFTAACAPCVYRGDNFPEDYVGSVFVCEPSGNLVRRNRLIETNGTLIAENAHPNTEFLTSTDERFRPVNLYTAPDGTLYLIDLYHGILQHRIYLTSYLRHQIEARHLETPQNQGRIWRIVHDRQPVGPKPALARATTTQLVQALSHPNGWWRDTAQRLLVEQRDPIAVPLLQAIARTAQMELPRDSITRLHALWTLDGMDRLDLLTLRKILDDPNPRLRVAALRLAEGFLRMESTGAALVDLRLKVFGLARETNPTILVQLALTLGEMPAESRIKALLTPLTTNAASLVRDAAQFSLRDPVAVGAAAASTTAASGPTRSPEEQQRFSTGKATYEITCQSCHQPHGKGQEGLAPPLVGSEWVSGPAHRLIRIALHGLHGPIQVSGQKFALDMPALGILEDEQIASVLTYVRGEWGHRFSEVSTEMVKKLRAETEKREEAWTQEELLKIP